jgi:hypothetical protein
MSGKVKKVSKACTAVLDALPDVFVVTGIAQGAPRVTPGSVDELIVHAKKSPVGKGDQTVFDEEVRKSLEVVPGEGCNVEWPQLAAVLEEVSRGLVHGRPLRAEPYKVLVYQEGDFFRWHRDSKKSENHVLTLCVDLGLETCEGGALLFRPDWTREGRGTDDDVEDDGHDLFGEGRLLGRYPPLEGNAARGSEECSWNSGGRAGAYACWYATQMHGVGMVRDGRRAVVLYNVFIDSADRVAVPKLAVRPLVHASSWFGRLGKDIAELVCRKLSLQSLSRLFFRRASPCRSASIPERWRDSFSSRAVRRWWSSCAASA